MVHSCPTGVCVPRETGWQQTLLRAYQALGQFRGQTAAEQAAWLRQILARVLANAVRDLARAKRDIKLERSLESALADSSARLETWLVADEASPSQRAERNEQLLLLSEALEALPEAQREVLVLRHCRDWSLAEIAHTTELFGVAREFALAAGLVGKGKADLTDSEQLERRKYADHAVQALHEAITNGFRDIQQLEKHPDLAVLRDRQDFQSLLNDLKK